MRYFAMIDGERKGPFTLDELHEAGVRPDTYVWCKEMDEWEKAEDVAEICRFYRQRIFDLMHPSASPADDSLPEETQRGEEDYEDFPLRFRHFARQAGADPVIREEEPDYDRRPSSLVPLAVMLMLFCNTITGLVALYYAIRSRKAWNEAHRSDQQHNKALYSDSERQALSREAHEYARMARMWCGITFFLGFFLMALVSSHLLN
ncbi:MAG: GYF domain-containing protein [Muribaculaceae bacterium]|nr:GYF domain-containing protein [Muribaculaceae bacterium]